jgi:hypothetical protein
MPIRFARVGALALASAAIYLLTLTGSAHAVPSLGPNCFACHGDATVTSNPASGGTLNFGRTLVGSTSVGMNWTLSNTHVDPSGNNGGGFNGSFPGTPGGSPFSPTTSAAIVGNTAFAPGYITPGTSESRMYFYAPTTRGPSTATLSFTPGLALGCTVTPSQNCSNFSGAAPTVTITLAGQGVAPVISLDTSQTNAGNVRVGTSGSAKITVNNTGDGNTSGAGAVSNLQGSVGGAAASFSGSGGTFNLQDGGTQAFTYTFVPTSRGTATAGVSVNATNGSTDGGNHAQSLGPVTLSGTGVGPVYSSSTPSGGTLSFAALSGSNTLTISNTTSDTNLGSLTGLTLLSAHLSGADAGLFSLANFTAGMQLAAGGTFGLGLDYASSDSGPHSALLTIVTDEGAALGAAGDQFTYNLAAAGAIIPGVPEPDSLQFMLAGLVGIGLLLRLRRRTSSS